MVEAIGSREKSQSTITNDATSETATVVRMVEVRRNSTILTTVAVSLVASFVMVDWDFSLDPIASTINHAWIWTQGGGYFGVPISNFLGWSFTVWIFFQLFALYQRGRASEDVSRALPTTHYLQSIIAYFWTAFGFVLGYLLRPTNTAISDPF